MVLDICAKFHVIIFILVVDIRLVLCKVKRSFFNYFIMFVQRICIKFCLWNQFFVADLLKMVQNAFGAQACSKKPENVLKTKSSPDGHLRQLINLADTVEILKRSENTILKDDLCLRRGVVNLVSKTYNLLEKERYVNVCKEMISDYEKHLLLQQIRRRTNANILHLKQMASLENK